MKYGTYNEELGYSNGPEFDTPFEAINAAWGKCRRHTVWEYDDSGKYVRTLSRTEQHEIYEREAMKAPADYRVYYYPAATPLMNDEAYKKNKAIIQPYKDIADRFNIEWGEKTIQQFYTDMPGQKGVCAIGIRVALNTHLPLKAAVDVQARTTNCPCLRTFNKYHKLVCEESYSEE